MAIGGLASIGNIALRVILIISAAVIIGLSVKLRDFWETFTYTCNLYNQYYSPKADCNDFGWTASSRYGIFVGVWGMVAAFVGLVPTFVESSIALIGALAFDVLAVIFYIAGAVTFTVKFKQVGGDDLCDFATGSTATECNNFKMRTQADLAFMYIGFVVTLIALVFVFLGRRSK